MVQSGQGLNWGHGVRVLKIKELSGTINSCPRPQLLSPPCPIKCQPHLPRYYENKVKWFKLLWNTLCLKDLCKGPVLLSVVPHACVSWHAHNHPLLGFGTQASGRDPKDSNSLQTSRDNCGVVRDLKNTADQGAQLYVTTKYPLFKLRSFKRSVSYRLIETKMYNKAVLLRNEGRQCSHKWSKANLWPCCWVCDCQKMQVC